MNGTSRNVTSNIKLHNIFAEGLSTMNLNTGNLVRKATSILDMQLGKFMPSPKIWLPTFQLIGKSF